ncbi:MAG: hypothetical protein FD126_1740 [Elusimicrobia bacterium]|nr:MAG: hypothetical protein FD126_1740 [Elusimicrobiota bacterium]
MRLLPLAAVLLFAPLSGRCEDVSPELKARAAPLFVHLGKEIHEARDPYAAKAFLDRGDSHDLLRKADPEAFDRLFEEASQLVDLHRAVNDHMDASTDGYPLLDRPADLMLWRRKYADFKDERTLASALLEWDTLAPDLRTALAAAGHKKDRWGATSFGSRSDALEAALSPAVARIKGSVARSPAEAQALHAQAGKLWPYLDKDVKAELSQHLERTDAAAAALADAQQRLGKNPDPALAAKLAEARASGNVTDMLGKLGSLFDGMNVRNEAVERAGPGRADQRLRDEERSALADMLETGVRREIAGTKVGDRLLKMYEKEPFNLVVRPMPPGTMGQYTGHDNVLAVSEDLLLKMARQEGKTAQDLLKGEMFDKVLKATLSTIVHEAVHQEQNVWRRDKKLPYWDVVEHEIEAKSLEAAFVLEKSAQDPKGYGKFMAENQKSSILVREGAAIAQMLARSPKTFRMAIQADYYPSEISIEANAAGAYDNEMLVSMNAAVRAELKRRQALAPAERQRLEASAAPRLDGRYTREQWNAAILGVQAETLERMAENQRKAIETRTTGRADVPRIYSAYRERDAESANLTAGVLAALPVPGKDGAWPVAHGTKVKAVPPPPGGGGGGGRR